MLHDVEQILLSLAGLAITAATPFVLKYVNTWLTQHNASQAQDDLDQALTHGLGIVLDIIKSRSDTKMATAPGTTAANVKDDAVHNAADLVMKLAPGAIRHLNISHDDVINLINARLANIATPNMAAAKMLAGPTASPLKSTPTV